MACCVAIPPTEGLVELSIPERSPSPRRDLEVIDCELRLFLAIRKMAREADGRTPNTARIDALLDERSATMVLNTTVAPA